MNTEVLIMLCAVCSYLAGAANPAIILSRLIYREDIRSKGSNNPGFTNFGRVYGNRWAWLVMVLDISKAIVVCAVFGALFSDGMGSFQLGAAVSGLFAVIGHCFPIWYGFKGGKGFLAAATAIWFIDWRIGLILLGVLLFMLLVSHYMSLSVMVSMLLAPVLLAAFGYDGSWVMVCLLLISLLVVFRHWLNIVRLVNGKENRFYFSKRG